MRRTILLAATLVLPLLTSAQDTSLNHVVVRKALDEAGATFQTTVTYFDGLGRPVQTSTDAMSDTGAFTVTARRYDCRGLACEEWLPLAGGTSPSRVADPSSLAVPTYNDEPASVSTTYDCQGRPVFATLPGAAWVGSGTAMEYLANAPGEVKRYLAPLGSTSLVPDGFFPAGVLDGVCTTDADGMSTTVFTDRGGRKVMERRDGGGLSAETYYVHDARGNLRFVLQPMYQQSGHKAVHALEYRYDEHGRMVKSIMPGCEHTRYWYDVAGRLTFMQDARLRELGRYRFFLHDDKGRICITGLCSDCIHATVGAGTPVPPLSTQYPAPLVTRTGGGGLLGTGYTLGAEGVLQDPELEEVVWWDDYTFLSGQLAGGHALLGAVPAGACARGLETGRATASSGGGMRLALTLYDARERPSEVRTVSPDGVLNTTLTTYTHTDAPSVVSESWTDGNWTVTATTSFSYHSPSGKTASATVTAGAGGSQFSATVAGYSHDGVGRLASIDRGTGPGLVSYGYDIQGHVTSVSSPSFSQTLHYADGPFGTRLSGGAAAMTWTNAGYDQLRGYKYHYDGLGRLAWAEYGERADLDNRANRYDERVLEYDLNGNILRMQRRGRKDNGVYGKVDNLHLQYSGGRLTKVVDDAPNLTYEGATEFVDDANAPGVEYGWDGGGRLLWDRNRGVASIEYDAHGDMRRMQKTDGCVTEHHRAGGVKIKAVRRTAVPNVTVPMGRQVALTQATTLQADSTTYLGSLLLHDGTPWMLHFPGGFCTFEGDNLDAVPHYVTADHQGSVRVVAAQDGTVEQVTNYYPFGLPYSDGTSTNTAMQPLKYNGKELDMTHGWNTYDYGARLYDPALCRWTTMDPVSEMYHDVNPYAYCGNDPVNKVDPKGKDYWTTNDKEQIIAFWNAIGCGQTQFDFSDWQHYTDNDFVSNLFYNDETKKYYTSYSIVENGEIQVIGTSFDADLTPVSSTGVGYVGAYVYKPLDGFWLKANHFLNGTIYYDGFFNWKVDLTGRIIGFYPITGTAPIPGKGKNIGGKQKMGHPIGKMSGNRVVQKEQIDALSIKHHLTKEERRLLHEEISHQGLGYHEIEKLIFELFEK